MLSWLQHRWTGLYLLMLAFGGLLLFLYGFFPLKYHTGQMAHLNDLPMDIGGVSIDGPEVYDPGETSVILMIIDGLRYDFVTQEYMPYTENMLKNQTACMYVAVADPPTVTMPRIKAMMTGSVSTFADVALNFGAPAVRGDSVLRVAAAKGRRSVMFGDDTWLRLFPGLWAESDGTTSFYVTDYTEVDNNVTRHLDRILKPDDKKKPPFDFLVLHYLGLDHIGHLEGANSPKVKPKLLEMDNIIEKIFDAMGGWDREAVLLVGGDHGMRDAGGHGGASPAEMLVPMFVTRNNQFKCPHKLGRGPSVTQTDVAPTVAWLLNAPLPGDSTGRLLPDLLPHDMRQHLYLLHYVASRNARAVIAQRGPTAMDTEFYKQFQRAERQFSEYLKSSHETPARLAKEFYDNSLSEMSKYLMESTVNFDMFAIVIGILIIFTVTLAIIGVTLYSLQSDDARKHSTSYHARFRSHGGAGAMVAFAIITIGFAAALFLACAITETKSSLCSMNFPWIFAFIGVAVAFSIAFFITKSVFEENMNFTFLNELNYIDLFLVGATHIHSWTFMGTSFIEEEHMTWYFFWNTLMFFILIRTLIVVVIYYSKRVQGATEVQEKPELQQKMNRNFSMLPKWVFLIALHRYLRTMNQTGDRWLFLPDTADWLNHPDNVFYLQAHLLTGIALTFIICLWNLRYTKNMLQTNTAFTILEVACVVCYRITTKSLPSPFPNILTWDTVHIVNVFWGLLIAHMTFEVLSFTGAFRRCGVKVISNPNYHPVKNDEFVYNKPKAKNEDYVYGVTDDDEPWNSDKVKLNLVRSVSHLALNHMMLIILLLMRPHNVILIPSIYVTCVLTSQCMDHSLLDMKPSKRKEVLDTFSQCLVHIWIGCLFFFYQGNSNSLASVDLGAGYVGLRSYCPVRVAARMGLHAYAGPAIAGITLFAGRAAASASWDQYLKSVCRCTNLLALQRVYSVAVYATVAAAFRHHLFVWTVFSPKLLYDLVGTVFTLTALLTVAEIVAVASLAAALARLFARKGVA